MLKKTLFFPVFLLTLAIISTPPTPADQVIEAALEVAESLSGESKIQANVAILIAKRKLGEGDDAELLRKTIEIAKRDQDAYQRGQKFAKIVSCIVPKDAHSYDVILDHEAGYFVLDAILMHCGRDLAYPILENILGRQTDPKIAQNMRSYANRVYQSQPLDEAVALAGRLKNPELRQFVIANIRNNARTNILQRFWLGRQTETDREYTQQLLTAYYPDLDTSDGAKCVTDAMTRMSGEIAKVIAPDVRFSAYTDLIRAYRKLNTTIRDDISLGYGAAPFNTPAAVTDPTLQQFIAAAEKTANQLKDTNDDKSRQAGLTQTCRWALENADTAMATQIVDHMLTIPAEIEDPFIRAHAMLKTISLLYKLGRTDEANRLCDEIMQIAVSAEIRNYNLDRIVLSIAAAKARAGFFPEARAALADISVDKNLFNAETIVHEFTREYTRHVAELLQQQRYDDALQFIDDEPMALGDQILLLKRVADALREAGEADRSDAVYQQMFARVDELVEHEAANLAAGGKADNLGIGEDRQGWMGASVERVYSHPVVKLWRERGDFAGAADLADKLFGTHIPRVEILYIARHYADTGEYDRAMEAGGSLIGEFGSDSGIRGYVAYVMFTRGEKAAAEKLLTDTLGEIEAGNMPLHGDFIVGLLKCGKIDDAIRLSKISAEDETKDRYQRQPTQILRCLLTAGHEVEAMRLVEDWPAAAGKAWGIWTLIRWNREEYLDQGRESIITPEWKQRWVKFFRNYADTLDESDAANRIGEWNRAAECLIQLDAPRDAVKVLEKALAEGAEIGVRLEAHKDVHPRMVTGELLMKLGERAKAETAFMSALKACEKLSRDYEKADYLKSTLSAYTASLREEPASQRDRQTTLKEIWTRRSLFSSYPIE